MLPSFLSAFEATKNGVPNVIASLEKQQMIPLAVKETQQISNRIGVI
jgi:hypothetical protein